MKIIDAINMVDDLKPNIYTQEQKVSWLSKLDGTVKREIIDTHKGSEDITFDGYTPDTPVDTELLIQEPHDDVYLAWLEAQVDYFNGEYTKYNNSITRFNDLYQAYANDYNRHHLPIGCRNKYF